MGAKLGLTQDSVDSMDVDEFHTYVAYFKLQSAEYRDQIEDTIAKDTLTTADYILKHYYKSTNGNTNK